MADDSTPPEAAAAKTRLDRVREILDQAAGSSTADYQGYGRFWNLPLPQFEAFVLYGIRMIAPAERGNACDDIRSDPEPRGPGREALGTVDAGARGGSQGAPAPASGSAAGCGCGTPAAAPAPADSSCCGSAPSSGGGRSPKYPGRGAKSGLIQGLKGEFPFDGTHFPPLPWGGTAAAPSDIETISSWIDDGCPDGEPHVAGKTPEAAAHSRALALGNAEHPPMAAAGTNSFRADRGEIKQRKNVEYLSADELCKLRYAIHELQKLNKYPLDVRSWNSWAQLHGNECQHGWEQFLPWHRIYLYEFEQALQDIVPDVTLPYWNWPAAQYLGGKIPPGGISGVIPAAYRAGLDAAAVDKLVAQGVPAGVRVLSGKVFNSGIEFFEQVVTAIGNDATLAFRPQILGQLYSVNPLWYEYRYPGMFFNNDGSPAGNGLAKQFHHHYPTQQDIDQYMAVTNWRDFGGGPDYDQAFGILDMDPHNTIHIWVGGESPPKGAPGSPNQPATGDMLNNLTAAFDPIFWGHHSNVDRMWADWQERHPGLLPEGLDGALSGLNFAVRDAISIQKLGYEYVAAATVFPTDPSTGLARFRSAQAGVSTPVLAGHRKAELRLHGVQQPATSFTVRAFLNQPDADANTPMDGNDHYAGHVSFFGHGDCIGGPGHCDPVPRGQRKFDRRPPHHNQPWNARLDVSDTVQKLVAAGAHDLQVNLVVVGPDQAEHSELLKLDAVSLNFKE